VKSRSSSAPGIAENREAARAVRPELGMVEHKLATMLDSVEPLITEICHYLVDGAGKRLRPTFILLVFRACGGSDAKLQDAIDAAIALELIHSATLLHDDIIDGGTLRRGKPSAFARYGAAASLVAGDFLFCRAFELCGRFEERLVQTAARACVQLTEGEVMEGRMRHRPAATFDDYMAVITRKTASLFGAGGRVAADLSGVSAHVIETAEQIGLAVGRAFQMVDDLLDVIGPEEKIGKRVGSDLRAGVLSLPIVLGLGESKELSVCFANGKQADETAFDLALQSIRIPSVINRARNLVADQIASAHRLLGTLPASGYRDSLEILLEDQINRAS
jgi:geranylgeranyl pyrophosphate synthase